ncbi:MAG: hemerythrin domain-containing protein [Bacteroidetes bacterium]|nr:hemerythrin domain-containing protein [Bacteroidota bacterium]
MNNALKMLYDEHEIIGQAIEIAKQASSLVGNNDEQYEKTVLELIRFFKNYSDQYHHRKEEEILFPEMEKKNEMLSDGVIHEMLSNHEDFREMIRSIEKSLSGKNYAEAQSRLEQYTEALLDHIAVENDEVFQMTESLFSEDELDKIYFRFQDSDRELGDTLKEEWVSAISQGG